MLTIALVVISMRIFGKSLSRTVENTVNFTVSKYFTSSSTLIIFSLIIALSILYTTHLMWSDISQHGIALTILGAGFVVVGFLFTAGIKLHTEIRDHAFSLLRESRSNSELRQAMYVVGGILREHREKNEPGLSLENVKIIRSNNKKLASQFKMVANFFEIIAIAIKHREVQESLLEDYYDQILINFYEGIKQEYLPFVRRLNKDSLTLYMNLEKLSKCWQSRNEKSKKQLYSRIKKYK